MSDPIPAQRGRQRRMLLLMAALFFVPVATSFILYYVVEWRPSGGTNHGELYSPARPLPETTAPLTGKWSLVYAGHGACDEDCRRSLVFARQTRLSLNKDMTRVNRVFLATADCCDRAYFSGEHEGLEVVDAAADPSLAAVLAALPATEREHSLFIVDPLGNLVMRYDTRLEPRGLLDDMKKLLKLSNIG